MIKNIFEISRSSNSSFGYPEESGFSLPTDATVGLSYFFKNFLFSIDNEIIYGNYGGSKQATFWFIRGGIERPLNSRFTFRGGVILPVIARTSSLGDMRDDLPWPKVDGTVGIGAKWGRFILDLAVFGDPARSYVDQAIRIRGAASLTMVL